MIVTKAEKVKRLILAGPIGHIRWTDAMLDRVVALDRQMSNMTGVARVLAEEFGRPFNRLNILRALLRLRPDYHAEREARIKADRAFFHTQINNLAALGYSAPQIGKKLGCSEVWVREIAVDLVWGHDCRLHISAAPDPSTLLPRGTLLPDDTGFLLWKIPAAGCHWPIGVDADDNHRFCGAPRVEGTRKPYCVEHRIVSTPGTAKALAACLNRIKQYPEPGITQFLPRHFVEACA